MAEFFDIDGNVMEGGGQILRMSVALSAILGVPVRVSNIRARRSNPGLAAQHMTGIQLVSEMCQAKLRGAHIGSTEIEFSPGKIRGGHYVADTHTAGSISLLLQIALPVALAADAPVTLRLRGGTNAELAPQVDYMARVFRGHLANFGADFTQRIHRRGYFPKGGGEVTVEITPVRNLRGATITQRGSITAVRGDSFVAGLLPIKIAQEMAEGAKAELKSVYNNVSIKCYKEDRSMAPDNCSGINLWCTLSSGCVLGADALCRRGVDAREAGRGAGAELRKDIESGACLDQHSQDQVILYMALAEGKSSVRVGDITLHTKTAMHIAELLTKIKFDVRPDGDQNLIECTGLGFKNKNLPAEKQIL